MALAPEVDPLVLDVGLAGIGRRADGRGEVAELERIVAPLPEQGPRGWGVGLDWEQHAAGGILTADVLREEGTVAGRYEPWPIRTGRRAGPPPERHERLFAGHRALIEQ